MQKIRNIFESTKNNFPRQQKASGEKEIETTFIRKGKR